MKQILFSGRGAMGVVAALVLLLAGCRQAQPPVTLQGKAQGTYYTIIYYDSLQRNLQPQIDSLLADFDLTASLWVDSSLLCRVNRNEVDTVSPLFASMLRQSLEMNAYTGGCFDCTVGKLVSLWGFGAEKQQLPDSTTVDSLLRYMGPGRVALHEDSNTGTFLLVKQYPETALDFNAIAQGVSSDMVGAFLEGYGIRHYLVDIGGEVVARGRKANGTPWSVGIERPAAHKYSAPTVELAIALEDAAVVTSGSYRKYYEKEGMRYSHTIDPSTGYPVQHSLLSVSVIDSVAWRADALATAFMVMGLERGLQFIREHPEDPGVQQVFFIYDSAGSYQTYATEAFRQHILP